MEKLHDDLLLACSVQRHGLHNWEMVAVDFSDAIFNQRRCIFDLSPAEFQVRYNDLKKRFKNHYPMDFNEDDDDDNEDAFVKLMVDKLKKTYIEALREDVKLREISVRKHSLILYKLEAEERIELMDKEGDDKYNDKRENINNNENLIKILDVLRSHKHCCLFESRLHSQGDRDYMEQIRQHMDLEIIEKKIEEDAYSKLETGLFRDLLLMFNNAMVYYPKETVQYSAALELRAIIMREMGKKPLFDQEIVCGLGAAGNKTVLVKDKWIRNKAQEGESSSVRRSERVRSKACETKNDPDYEYYGQGRRRRNTEK